MGGSKAFFLKISERFSKFLQNCVKFCKLLPICLREDEFLVELEKCCKMRIWMRKSALIQPRMSFGKSDVSPSEFGGTISRSCVPRASWPAWRRGAERRSPPRRPEPTLRRILFVTVTNFTYQISSTGHPFFDLKLWGVRFLLYRSRFSRPNDEIYKVHIPLAAHLQNFAKFHFENVP